MPPERRLVRPDQLTVNPDWKPPSDPVFRHLLEEATSGAIPVYFAAIPPARILRYQAAFRPELTKDGDKVVRAIMDEWRQGGFLPIWVYPKGDLFVASDDYFTLAAAERGEPDFLPCWVLGRPSDTIAKDVQGPITPEGVRKMLGLTDT